MPNHFHLVVETPQPNLVAGMKWFLGTYTARFNRRHKVFGHLFSGRSFRTGTKGDPGKVCIVRRLRQETTMTLAWIAERLHMGVWTHVSNLLRAAGKSRGKAMSVVTVHGFAGAEREK